MKEMNETQLRGWRPRRPSRALKSHIFERQTASGRGGANGDVDVATWNWHFAAPAIVCVCFATLLLHFNSGSLMHEGKPVLAMISSNDNRSTSFSDHAQETENHLSSITFDWTNHTGFQSSIGFTPTTNSSN